MAVREKTLRAPNPARYPVPVNADIPNMTVEFIAEHDPYVHAMDVKSIGDIFIVGVTASIANAVFHAAGRRLCFLPP